MRVGRPHDQLHIGRGGRVDHAGGRPIAARHGVFAITPDRFFGAIDAVGAERACDRREKRFEIRRVMQAPLCTVPCKSFTRCRWDWDRRRAGALVASSGAACAVRGAVRAKAGRRKAGGIGPPVAQSNNSTVCTIGA